MRDTIMYIGLKYIFGRKGGRYMYSVRMSLDTVLDVVMSRLTFGITVWPDYELHCTKLTEGRCNVKLYPYPVATVGNFPDCSIPSHLLQPLSSPPSLRHPSSKRSVLNTDCGLQTAEVKYRLRIKCRLPTTDFLSIYLVISIIES